MFKRLKGLFNKRKSIKKPTISVENCVDIKEEQESDISVEEKTENTNEIVNLLFNSKTFFTLELKNEKGKFVKYVQIIDDNNGNTPLLGLIFTDKLKAEKYSRDELKKLEKYNVKVVEIEIDNIFNYINDLKDANCEGFVINYPFDWSILKF